jgi:hypothetical protein
MPPQIRALAERFATLAAGNQPVNWRNMIAVAR